MLWFNISHNHGICDKIFSGLEILFKLKEAHLATSSETAMSALPDGNPKLCLCGFGGIHNSYCHMNYSNTWNHTTAAISITK